MKNRPYVKVPASLAAMLILTSAAFGRPVPPPTVQPQIVALGSPTAFSNAVIAMITPDPITNPGRSKHY
jgi:hypothetical protein